MQDPYRTAKYAHVKTEREAMFSPHDYPHDYKVCVQFTATNAIQGFYVYDATNCVGVGPLSFPTAKSALDYIEILNARDAIASIR
jgi:hypothetical protein